MLHDPERHETLRAIAWNESRVRASIEHIVADTEARFSEDRYWPLHPRDRLREHRPDHVETSLYDGACGVFWAVHYLDSVGAAAQSRSHDGELDRLLERDRAWRGESREWERASLLTGETPIWMIARGGDGRPDADDALEALISGNIRHPARELMWGAPGTMLAALFLHERTGDRRWSDLFRLSADTLWSQLQWSPQYRCAYWTQEFLGRQWTGLDAVHGFVATALPLIRGRHLLDAGNWDAWERCIVNTVERTVDRLGDEVNWRPQLDRASDPKMLLQFCHGAPGFVICLAGLPGPALDDLLLAAGETVWTAGPLAKGSNLCHGTAGNGYAFLKLYQRTKDSRWLERARSFAMHAIMQTEEEAMRHAQSRYSLWTGDLGFAIYLWDCLRGEAQFPTLDVF
jgi:Lanthionine synthetase C-like protein